MRFRRRIWLILWILSLVGISYFGGNISYLFFWAMTFVPVISFLYILFVYIQFRIYQEIESRTIICKQPVPYYFTLPNETFYTFAGLSVKMFSGFSYVTDIPEDKEYELLPRDADTHYSNLICKYRGEYEVGVKEVTISDYLGLFRFRYRLKETFKAVVLPRVLELNELRSMKELNEFSNIENVCDKTEADILTRDYVCGDALKHIHWKATAKEQKLKVRNMTGERKQGIVLALDTQRTSAKTEEYIPLENTLLEIGLALGHHFAEKRIPCKFIWNQQGIKQYDLEGINQFQIFYQTFSNMIFDEAEKAEKLLQYVHGNRQYVTGGTFLLVTHKLTENMMACLQLWAKEGMRVLVYLVTNEETKSLVRESNSRFKLVIIPVDGDLEEIL